MRMTFPQFVHAWLHADKGLALEYLKGWLVGWRRWHLSRHRKALIAQYRFGQFHLARYFSLDGSKRLGIDFYVHLGASCDLYHTPALEQLGYAYPDEPYLRYKQPAGGST